MHSFSSRISFNIEFIFSTIPRGLFGSLIVWLLQDNADIYELFENVCQYSDLKSFFH